jgi:hypothetical protein
MLVSRVNTASGGLFVVGDSGEGGPFEDGFFFLRSDFFSRNGEVEETKEVVDGVSGKKEASRSGSGGGGIRSEGCSASIASERKALLDRVFNLENTEDLTFRIWLAPAFAFATSEAERKPELELSKRSRS